MIIIGEPPRLLPPSLLVDDHRECDTEISSQKLIITIFTKLFFIYIIIIMINAVITPSFCFTAEKSELSFETHVSYSQICH